MTKHNVTLNAVFDDVARTVTITGMGAPPPRPPEVPEHMWFGQTGPGFEVTMTVARKDTTPNPTGEYLKLAADGVTVERYSVEYINGAWQMPGVKIAD